MWEHKKMKINSLKTQTLFPCSTGKTNTTNNNHNNEQHLYSLLTNDIRKLALKAMTIQLINILSRLGVQTCH